MYLSDLDRDHLALAEIGPAFQDEATRHRRGQDAPTTSETGPQGLILNNGVQRCTPPLGADEKPVTHLPAFPGYHPGIKGDLLDRPHALRDWVKASLNEAGLGGKWLSLSDKGGWWPWFHELKSALGDLNGITSNNFNPYRDFNFQHCGAKKSWGTEVVYADGDVHATVFSCGETACPSCYDRGKQQTAERYLNKVLALAEVWGLTRLQVPVFTLPECVEALAPKGSDNRKAVSKGINIILRKHAGFKTRDAVFAYQAVHAVGDSDLMRDRTHFHCGLLPIAARRTNGKVEIVVNRDLLMLDADAVRADYQELLTKIFGDAVDGKAQVNLRWIPLDRKNTVRALAHRLKYDLRGFGKDVMRAPVLYNPETRHAVLTQGKKGGYAVYSVDQVAARWDWVRGQRDLRAFGLLHDWNKYADQLGVEWVEDPEPEVAAENDITVVRTCGRAWVPGDGKKKGGVKWMNLKQGVREDGSSLPETTIWGRKGSEGYWSPKMDPKSPQKDDQAPSGDMAEGDLVQGWLPGVERPAEGAPRATCDMATWWRAQWVE